MKSSEIIVLGLAGLAVYLIWRSQMPATTVTPMGGKPVAPIKVGDTVYNWTGMSYGGTSDTGGAFGLGGF